MKTDNIIKDLKNLTYIDALTDINVMRLILSGLNQLDNAKDKDKNWVIFKTNGDKYRHLSYMMRIGANSTLRACNEVFGINTSHKYNKNYTVQSMIEHYNNLSHKQKKELAQSVINKEKNVNDILPKFIYKVLKTINEIYPSEKTNNGEILRKTDYNMIRDVSGFFVLTKNTLNFIRNYE